MMRRVETGDAYSGEVPLKLFRDPAFKEKTYLDKAVRIALRGIQVLTIPLDEEIRICSGYVLSKVREALRERGFKVVQTKIEGATQNFAEKEFVKSLTRLGVGEEEAVVSMRSFNGFLTWVMEDLRIRERYVKTGWRSWARLREAEK